MQRLLKGADGERPSPIAKWVKSRKGAWCSYGCTEESKKLMGDISFYCIQQWGYDTSKRFLGGADALLIARAGFDGGIVVTQESVHKAPRIPGICDHFGIKHMPMNRMSVKLGLTWSG